MKSFFFSRWDNRVTHSCPDHNTSEEEVERYQYLNVLDCLLLKKMKDMVHELKLGCGAWESWVLGSTLSTNMMHSHNWLVSLSNSMDLDAIFRHSSIQDGT